MLDTIIANRVFRDRANVETIIAVAEVLNITKASKVLGCSQPAISVRIRRLEQVLGTRLIIRRRGSLTLTSTGEQLYAIMKRFQKTLRQIEADIQEVKENRLSFTLGLSSILMDFFLPHCLYGMRTKVDGDLYFKNDRQDALVDEIIEGRIDMAIVETKTKMDGLVYQDWVKDEIVLFSQTPLAQTFVPEALYGYLLLLYTEDAFIQHHIQELFKRTKTQQVFLEIVGVIDNIISVKQAILNDRPDTQRQLVSWSPRSAISEEIASQRLYASSLGTTPVEHQFYVVYKRDRKDEPVLKEVLGHLQDVSKSMMVA
jgi:DNA-binding transcriptional LysR family regulator